MFEISITREFAAAHAIRLPDGSLEPVHGHNWPVEVTVSSAELDRMDTVMDFHVLERGLDRLIEQVHNRHLNEVPPFTDGKGGLAINTTAERVAQWIGQEMGRLLPDHARLVSVAVGEAPGCKATYRPDV